MDSDTGPEPTRALIQRIRGVVAQPQPDGGTAYRIPAPTEETLLDFEHAVAERPDDAELRCAYAGALSQLDRTAAAIEEYRQALQIEPGLYLARGQLASQLLKAGEVEAAIAEFRLALEQIPRQDGTEAVRQTEAVTRWGLAQAL